MSSSLGILKRVTRSMGAILFALFLRSKCKKIRDECRCRSLPFYPEGYRAKRNYGVNACGARQFPLLRWQFIDL